MATKIFVNLPVKDLFFTRLTPKPVSDATRSTEVLVCLSRDSRDAVDDMVRQALDAGGTAGVTSTR